MKTYACFFSRSFIALALTFRSLTHSQLIFIYGVTQLWVSLKRCLDPVLRPWQGLVSSSQATNKVHIPTISLISLTVWTHYVPTLIAPEIDTRQPGTVPTPQSPLNYSISQSKGSL